MILLNFAHPLTAEHLAQLVALTGQTLERVVEVPSQIDVQQPLAPQVATLADEAGLSSAEWQTLPLLVNPPALNFSAAVLLSELHGRCGYFPPCVRLRPVPDSLPRQFEVAEILDLQAVRDAARHAKAGQAGSSQHAGGAACGAARITAPLDAVAAPDSILRDSTQN